ncbi:MAG: TonB-dependent receptor [Terracidiphilus sp.]|jgi:outer membrane receptor protein involved in Fe transport
MNRILLFAVGVACTVIMMLGASSTLWAQQAAGSITGTVVDPSGSAVANATVTVRDVDRGTTWTTKTTDAGLYEFPQIPVGNVQVRVEAAGFPSESRNSFTLVLNQIARVDFHLKLGKVNESIVVNDIPPLLQTGSTEIGTLIDANAAVTLPLATRDINQLTLLAPGVLTTNIFSFQLPETTFGTGRPMVNGAREQDNNFTLDGMDVNQPDNNDVAYTLSPDAVQEFNIITSNAAADYGSYAGGVIVESTKSGTNKFHGDLFEYLRNDAFNANTWQNKAIGYLVDGTGHLLNGATSPSQDYDPRATLRWNEFGGTVGGPIIKNKLFFFADEETSIYNQPATTQNNQLIPTAFLTGDLSSLCTAPTVGGTFNGNGICSVASGQLYSPYANGVSGAPAAFGSRPAIPNNKVPMSSTVASKLIALPAFTQQFETSAYKQSGFTHDYQGDMKIDWQPSANDHIMGRYSQMYTLINQSFGTDVLTPNSEREYPLKNFVVDYVRTFTPALVNDFRVGTQIFPANDQIYSNASGGDIPSEIGFQGDPVSILPQMSFGYGPLGGTDAVEIFHDTTYEAEDSLTWTHGRHSLHAGFELYHYDMNDEYAGNNGAAGQITFNGQYTSVTKGGVGSAFADFLLGLPSEVDVASPFHLHLTNSLYAAFAQDNYQVKHNLTLNLGLRYEVVTPRSDRTKDNNVNFDKITGAPEIGTNYNTYTGIGNFQPRIGFAWQPEWAPNTVIRGAYDISSYMEGNGIGNMADLNPPNTISVSQKNNSGAYLQLPETTLDQGYTPYGAACTAAQLLAYAPACLQGKQTHATDPNLRPAMNQQWNLTVQHQFKNNLTTSLGYVGNKDDHMSDIYIYNQGQLTSANTVVPGPYLQNLIAAGVGQARFNASDGISRFEALEATVSQKNFHGLDVQANFTWEKCMADSLGYFGSYGDEEVAGASESQSEQTYQFFQNEYNPKGDYGLCATDAAASFNAYGIYKLPFGKGKQFAGNAPKALDEVIGGWDIAVDTTLRSGFAITPFTGNYFNDQDPNTASSLTGGWQDRPSCLAGQSSNHHMQFAQIGPGSIGMLNLNPSFVTEPANFAFGNCQSGALRGPHLKTADMNLDKKFPITEKVNVLFMAQFMNLTNTPVFSVPAGYGAYSSCQACNGVQVTGYSPQIPGASVGTYGLLDGTNPGREVEFSLKVNF